MYLRWQPQSSETVIFGLAQVCIQRQSATKVLYADVNPNKDLPFTRLRGTGPKALVIWNRTEITTVSDPALS